MNKTVYLRDEEVPLWERARELAHDKLSPVIVDALKKFIAEKEAFTKGFERIEIRYEDSESNNLPRAKAFYGRWIIRKNDNSDYTSEDGTTGWGGAVAITAKGNVVIYGWKVGCDGETGQSLRYGYWLRVYPNFEVAAMDSEANYLARRALDKIGVPVEELDI